jgi:hypothetical protein
MPPRTISVCILAALMLCAGCATNPFALQTLGRPPYDDEAARSSSVNSSPTVRASVTDAMPVEQSPTLAPPLDPRLPPSPSANQFAGPPPTAAIQTATVPADNGADPRQLAALIDEVRAMGGLDPEAQRALLNDLKQCDPKLWPQMVQQFKTVLSYRKQMAATSQGIAKSDSSLPTATLSAAVAQLAGNATASDALPSKTAATAADIKPAADAKPIPDTTPVKPIATVAGHTAPADATTDKPAAKLVAQPTATAAAPPATATSDAWQTQLAASILELESQSAGGAATPADIDRQINLRILYLAACRRDDAMRPISGMPPEQQQFWTKELYGLATYRDAVKQPDPQRRATEATMHLREAAAQLGGLAAPVVRNLAFCKEVTSFGVYTKFPNYEFASGDEALLYCELENLKAAATDRGYHTAVKGTYEVLDAHGARIAEQEFPVSDDFCANPRRDFFILYHIWIPKQIAAGSYTLQLTIEDTQSNKIGQSTVQFKVR